MPYSSMSRRLREVARRIMVAICSVSMANVLCATPALAASGEAGLERPSHRCGGTNSTHLSTVCTRTKRRSTTPIVAESAATKEPIWARNVLMPVRAKD